MNWFIEALKKYAVFSGRARRREYWWFALFYILITGALAFMDGLTGMFDEASGIGLLSGIFMLALFLPSLGVTVRRLHDIGLTGWWILVGLVPLIGVVVLLILAALRGFPGENKYGPDPRAIAA